MDQNVWLTDARTNTTPLAWTDQYSLNFIQSAGRPALAWYKKHLWCVHRGGGLGPGEDKRLWYTHLDEGRKWTKNTAFPKHFSASGPALAVFQEKLWCVHRGADDDQSLYYTHWDGTSWSEDTVLSTKFKHPSAKAPALAAFQGKLWCVHRGKDEDNKLYYTFWDGHTWSEDTPLPNHLSDSAPALATDGEDGGNYLLCVYRGKDGDPKLHYTYWDGHTWSEEKKVANSESADGPALCYNPNNNTVLCMHRGKGSDEYLWYTWATWGTFDDWQRDKDLHNHQSAAGPALEFYDGGGEPNDRYVCAFVGQS